MIEAFAPIEMLSGGYEYWDGSPCHSSIEINAYLNKILKGKTVISDSRAAHKADDRPHLLYSTSERAKILRIVKRNAGNYLILGGKACFRELGPHIEVWRIAWFAKRFDAEELRRLIVFRPDLEDFYLIGQDFTSKYINFAIYRRKI